MDSIDILPYEVILHILGFASVKDVFNIMQTSRRFSYLLEDKQLVLASLLNTYRQLDQHELDKLLLLHCEKEDELSVMRIQALLEAGAKPIAPVEQNINTPVFIVGPKIGKLLIDYGVVVESD
jgi:F-box domain.